MKKFFAVASIFALSVCAANAASLSDVSGAVKINKGEGFIAAVAGAELNAGDKVFVGKGGFASVNYGECAVALDKPTVFAVTEVPSCSSSAAITPTADVVDLPPPVFPILPVLGTVAAAGLTYVFITEVLCDGGGVSNNGC
jgi:hypothetical protein